MAEAKELKNVTSREYKVILDHRLFMDRKAAAVSFLSELSRCAERMPDIESAGSFDKTKKREIVFLDTPDATIKQNGWIFRQRRDVENGSTEYTLKCRSPDFFIARDADVRAGPEFDATTKFEEDIGAPFIPRYSRSSTVDGLAVAPKNLKQAAAIFPVLGQLVRDGEPSSDKVKLVHTNSITMFE